MYYFLTGPLRIGKSTVISSTLALLAQRAPLQPGGFLSYRAPEADPYIYMRPAAAGREDELYRLAQYNPQTASITCFVEAFEQAAGQLLGEQAGANLILMDELGFLEQQVPAFQQAVYATLQRDTPVLGVLRQADIPWHIPILSNPRVTVLEVTLANRDALPHLLAAQLAAEIRGKGERHD